MYGIHCGTQVSVYEHAQTLAIMCIARLQPGDTQIHVDYDTENYFVFINNYQVVMNMN